MASLALAFDILARDKSSAAFNSAGRSADGLGKKLGNVGRVASLAIGGAAVTAVAGLGAAMVGGVKAAVNYETLQKKTAAVIRSTGNVANISTKGIQNLASKLETLSGVDEELIINGQNVLATFTKIRNETGKGNKIFERATTSALDLSVALGTDLQSATTMVGKALNDPIAGLTSLSKAGIQFTEDQKNLIRTLVESGDTLGAQKVILAELETQFGGTAKAAGSGLAGDMARLKDAWDDAFRSLATALLPTLTKLASWLSEKLPGAIDTAGRFFGRLSDTIGGVIDLFQEEGLGGVLSALGDKITEALPVIGAKLLELGQAFVDWVAPQIPPLLLKVAELIVKIGEWIIRDGIPLLTEKAAKLAVGLIDWVTTDAIPGLLLALPGIIRDIGVWIVEEGVPAFIEFGKDLGSALAEGVKDSFVGVLENLNLIGGGQKSINDALAKIEGSGAGTTSSWGSDRYRGWGRNAAGTNYWRGGMSWVGEDGPELLDLPRGSRVIPNGKSMAMAGSFDALGEDQLLELRRQTDRLDRLISMQSGSSIAQSRGMAAGMG